MCGKYSFGHFLFYLMGLGIVSCRVVWMDMR